MTVELTVPVPMSAPPEFTMIGFGVASEPFTSRAPPLTLNVVAPVQLLAPSSTQTPAPVLVIVALDPLIGSRMSSSPSAARFTLRAPPIKKIEEALPAAVLPENRLV